MANFHGKHGDIGARACNCSVNNLLSSLLLGREREREIHLCTDDFGDKKGQLQVKERYFEIFVEDDGRFS